jgi:hypothetical protein
VTNELRKATHIAKEDAYQLGDKAAIAYPAILQVVIDRR